MRKIKTLLAKWLNIGYIESIPNRERKFGSATNYFRVTVIEADGEEVRLLLTDGDFIIASQRAKNNPEDFTNQK